MVLPRYLTSKSSSLTSKWYLLFTLPLALVTTCTHWDMGQGYRNYTNAWGWEGRTAQVLCMSLTLPVCTVVCVCMRVLDCRSLLLYIDSWSPVTPPRPHPPSLTSCRLLLRVRRQLQWEEMGCWTFTHQEERTEQCRKNGRISKWSNTATYDRSLHIGTPPPTTHACMRTPTHPHTHTSVALLPPLSPPHLQRPPPAPLGRAPLCPDKCHSWHQTNASHAQRWCPRGSGPPGQGAAWGGPPPPG